MNITLAEVAINAALTGKGIDALEERYGMSLSTLLDEVWDWAEVWGNHALARRAEAAYLYLTED